MLPACVVPLLSVVSSFVPTFNNGTDSSPVLAGTGVVSDPFSPVSIVDLLDEIDLKKKQ
jgi:hypothetical protein